MLKRFIIIEGNECTGKTTLVEELRSTLGFQGWDTKSLAHRPGDQFQRYLHEYINADRIVFNRAHYAELIYSQLYRNSIPFTQQQLDVFETVIRHQAKVVYCSLPIEAIKMRLDTRNNIEVIKPQPTGMEELSKIGEAFDHVFRNKSVIRYSPNTPKDLTDIIQILREWVLSNDSI